MKRSINKLIMAIILLSGCGNNQGPTTGEGSLKAVSEVSGITILSSAILSTASGILSRSIAQSEELADMSEFKICVKRIKLEDEDGYTIVKDPVVAAVQGIRGKDEDEDVEKEAEHEKEKHDEEHGELVFSPGLIDLTDAQTKSWGEIQLPVGFRLKKLIIKVKKDEKRCGVNYSLNYNGYKTEKDVEFKWKFEPAIDLEATTETLQLSFDSVVAHLKEAVRTGSIEKLKERVEEVEGQASAH